jgi:hypothetical protein
VQAIRDELTLRALESFQGTPEELGALLATALGNIEPLPWPDGFEYQMIKDRNGAIIDARTALTAFEDGTRLLQYERYCQEK